MNNQVKYDLDNSTREKMRQKKLTIQIMVNHEPLPQKQRLLYHSAKVGRNEKLTRTLKRIMPTLEILNSIAKRKRLIFLKN